MAATYRKVICTNCHHWEARQEGTQWATCPNCGHNEVTIEDLAEDELPASAEEPELEAGEPEAPAGEE